MNLIEIAKPQILKKAKAKCQKKAGTLNVISLCLFYNVLENKNKAILISDKKEINADIDGSDIKEFIITQIKNKFKGVIQEIHRVEILFLFEENKIKYTIYGIINNEKTFFENEL